MSDYIKQLEEQNEELRQKLAMSQKTCSQLQTLFDYLMPEWVNHTGVPHLQSRIGDLGIITENSLYDENMKHSYNGWKFSSDCSFFQPETIYETLEEAHEGFLKEFKDKIQRVLESVTD